MTRTDMRLCPLLVVVASAAALLAPPAAMAQPLASALGAKSPSGTSPERVAALLADAERRLSALEARLDPLQRHEGFWEMGDAAGPFTVYSEAGEPLLIDERLSMGDYGSSRGRYLFEHGGLAYYREERDARVLTGVTAGSMSKVITRLAFDSHGNLVAWEKTIDGRQSALAGYEADQASTHASLLLARVADPSIGSATARVTGTITCRPRIALPPTAVVTVRLEDVSRMDVAAQTIAEQTIRTPGQVPIAFSLEYDPTRIDPRHTYAVRVRIEDEGRLLFINTTRYGVITGDRPAVVEIVVDPVR